MLPRLLVLLACIMLSGMVQADDGPASYLIEFELWLDGEVKGAPRMIVEAGHPASMETTGSGRDWRIEVEVERPAAYENAPGDALWLHVAVHERAEGEWEALADTMLGVPEGEPATFAVVEGEVDEPSPEQSLVFLRATTSRLQPGEMPAH